MIKFIFLKVLRLLYRIVAKVIYLIIPFISKFFILLRLNSRIINQLNKIRSESHKTDNHSDFISKLIQKNKLIALDVGAQGGFFDGSFFFNEIFLVPIFFSKKKFEKTKEISWLFFNKSTCFNILFFSQ